MSVVRGGSPHADTYLYYTMSTLSLLVPTATLLITNYSTSSIDETLYSYVSTPHVEFFDGVGQLNGSHLEGNTQRT